MRGGIIALAFIIIVGVIIANAIARWQGTKVLLDGVTGIWKVSVNGLLGQTTK